MLDYLRRLIRPTPRMPAIAPQVTRADDDGKVHWFVDKWRYFGGRLYAEGWFFHVDDKVPVHVECTTGDGTGGTRIAPFSASNFGLPSADVAGHHGAAARNSRFRFVAEVESAERAVTLALRLRYDDGREVVVESPAGRRFTNDPYHNLRGKFFSMLRQQPGATVVEIGSRARSGNIVRDLAGPDVRYIGVDILQGPNVDLVCDAHRLSEFLPAGSADAIFSVSVFEHLLMPWKVAIEVNRVLKPGGIMLVMTHQAFPMHDVPWDYWRYSDQAWQALFNRQTGFEIVETALGEPVDMVAHMLTPITAGFEGASAFIGSAVICRKISDTALVWPVDVADVIPSMYPA